MSDPFWAKDSSILISDARLTEFFPTAHHTVEERLNAIARLSLYLAIALVIYHKQVKYISVFVLGMLFTYFVYANRPETTTSQETKTSSQDDAGIESLDNVGGACTPPTLDNPFMNVTMKDYLNVDPKTGAIADRPPACDINDPLVKQSADNFFHNNLYRDVNDIFGKMNSQRQFYTTPSTTVPNRQDEFARWLYASPKTCKEDQDYCLKYEDLRQNRYVFPDPEQNPSR